MRPAKVTIPYVDAIMTTAASGGCQNGTVVPDAKRNTIIMGHDGGKKLNVVATIPFGSRMAMNHTIIGAISTNHTGSNNVCASFSSLTDAPTVKKIELKKRTPSN